MNAKQIVGLIGAIVVIVGCFLPIANVPIVGGINYMFPPGGKMGDGIIVAGLALLGLLGATRGGSLLLLLASIGGALIFGYSILNLHGAMKEASETGGLAGAMMSTAGIGSGAAVIAVGLLTMFVDLSTAGAVARRQSTGERYGAGVRARRRRQICLQQLLSRQYTFPMRVHRSGLFVLVAIVLGMAVNPTALYLANRNRP